MSDNPNWSSGYAEYAHGYPAFDENFMYFPRPDTGTVIQTNLSDGTIYNANFVSGMSPNGCLIYDGYMYIANNFKIDGWDGVISQLKLSDNTLIRYWAQASNGASSIATDGTYLYITCYSGDSFIHKIEINHPENSVAYASMPATRGLAVYGDYLYIASEGPLGVSRAPLSNPSAYTTWANLPTVANNCFAVVIYNNSLFVSSRSGNNNIYKISLEDSNNQELWKASVGDSLRGIRIYNNYLYAYNANNGTVGRYYIDPPPVPSPPCFKEGTKILTNRGYKLVQDLRKGDMIKTLRDEYKAIEMIGKKEIIHTPTPEDRVKHQLYVCSKPDFEDAYEPLVITGCHSILVDKFVSEEQKQKTIEVNGKIYVTDKKYRLPACAHDKTTVYEIPGTYTIYHLALENEDYFMNYGIYANGLLVESCSRRYLKERSNMELIE